MPSFDVVSKVDQHEVTNAVDQTNRELNTRFDFKGSGARVDQEGLQLSLRAPSAFQVDQVRDVLRTRLAKRGIDLAALELGEAVQSGAECRQRITVREGVDSELARRLVKLAKESRLKIQAAIQGDQVRVSGKNRDDLQAFIARVKAANIDFPLQFLNFRD